MLVKKTLDKIINILIMVLQFVLLVLRIILLLLANLFKMGADLVFALFVKVTRWNLARGR